jgi:hypothetical protein
VTLIDNDQLRRESTHPDSALDRMVERAGRWTAKRTTRRSLLAKIGKAAVLVGGGPALATLIADPADARVCGQSGVSPRCPTFDCNDTWGWCWYATGCCAGGALKKICDCCRFRHPNVHGYCPPGTNVLCIVESCGQDPRLQRVRLERVITDSPDEVAARVRRATFPAGASAIAITDSEDPLVGAVAVAAAAIIGIPLIHVPRGRLGEIHLRALTTAGAVHAVVLGPGLPPELDQQLQGYGIVVERIGRSTDRAQFSAEVARDLQRRIGPRNVVAVSDSGVSLASAPAAAAFAAEGRYPLIIGADTERAGAGIYLVGPELAPRAADLAGAAVVSGGSPQEVAVNLARMARSEGRARGRIGITAPGNPVALALASLGGVLLFHDPGALGTPRDWIIGNRSGLVSAWLAGRSGSMPSPAIWQLQSALNGFDVQNLRGTGGQGLPVIDQPVSERPIGRARV